MIIGEVKIGEALSGEGPSGGTEDGEALIIKEGRAAAMRASQGPFSGYYTECRAR